jgi:hypothetical protein
MQEKTKDWMTTILEKAAKVGEKESEWLNAPLFFANLAWLRCECGKCNKAVIQIFSSFEENPRQSPDPKWGGITFKLTIAQCQKLRQFLSDSPEWKYDFTAYVGYEYWNYFGDKSRQDLINETFIV